MKYKPGNRIVELERQVKLEMLRLVAVKVGCCYELGNIENILGMSRYIWKQIFRRETYLLLWNRFFRNNSLVSKSKFMFPSLNC